MVRPLLALLLLSSLAVAAPVPKGVKAKAAGEAVVGVWTRGPSGGHWVWTFNADRTWSLVIDGETRRHGTYRVDATKSPAHLDVCDHFRDLWELGVYQFDGDTLHISFGQVGRDDRPAAAKPSEGRMWLDLVRRDGKQ